VAPLSGGAVASVAGVQASFLVIGGIMLAVGVAVLALVREPEQAREAPEAAGEAGE
jgi:hypothetical protein